MDDARAAELVRLLADGQIHSGEAIAGHLGITRAAVWKAVRRLTECYGLTIAPVRGRGYRLDQPLELLRRETVLEALSAPSRALLGELAIHERIDSTNSELARRAAAGAASGTVCVAEQQTAGRGRSGRRWISPFGVNLYCSLLWRYPLAPAALSGASLALGVVVARVLHAAGVRGIGLKWPNDVLWQRRKLAGLLLEVAGESQGPTRLIAGLGINFVMTAEQGADIDQPWVSLREAVDGGVLSRQALLADLLDVLLPALRDYTVTGLAPFLDDWREFDALRDAPAVLYQGAERMTGICRGIDGDGALLLETPAGLQRHHSGEISLRALERPA